MQESSGKEKFLRVNESVNQIVYCVFAVQFNCVDL